jgi:hypothetical protein
MMCTTKRTKDTKGSGIITPFNSYLRALRVLRGEMSVAILGCGSAALGLHGESILLLSAAEFF